MKAVAVFPGTRTVKIVEHEAPLHRLSRTSMSSSNAGLLPFLHSSQDAIHQN